MKDKKDDDGVSAITTIIGALKPLDNKTRQNVLIFALKQLGIDLPPGALIPHLRRMPLKRLSRLTGRPPLLRQISERWLNKETKDRERKGRGGCLFLKNLAAGEERRDTRLRRYH